MAIERWNPRQAHTRQEEFLLKRLVRTRRLFAFLREYRLELFDDAMQSELASMYRDTGAGKDPVCPALMAMATIVQGYMKTSDAETVEMTVVDLRWQMVLDCLGSTEPAFSQGSFQGFRERLIRHDMDRRLMEKTITLARKTGAFDWKKLPKELRVAIDSSPLEGAGKVEDTVNLLAHAGRKIVDCVAELLTWPAERVCKEAGIPLLAQSSVKKALDYTWSDPEDKAAAITYLVSQLTSLEQWISRRLPEEIIKPPLSAHVEALHQIIKQDLEPDPKGGGGVRVRDGVAPDRRISVEDDQMRHGRKSKSKRFNGYKRHLALELDFGLILACAITAANRPEEDAAESLEADLRFLRCSIGLLYIDRGYINAPIVEHVLDNKGEVICRPWAAKNGKLFPKSAFDINIRNRTITCPAGYSESIQFGSTVEFEPERCDSCLMRNRCTDSSPGHGRTVSIADNEPLQKKLRVLASTKAGRERLRERVAVEHSLAHAGRCQGPRAKYRGIRKNLFDWRRAAFITNLQTIQRALENQRAQKAA